MRKLTAEENNKLRSCKGLKGGKETFFDILTEIYKDDTELMEEITKCRTIFNDLSFLESYPAMMKSEEMYYNYMDNLLHKIGYQK